jgi:hypothetical protein
VPGTKRFSFHSLPFLRTVAGVVPRTFSHETHVIHCDRSCRLICECATDGVCRSRWRRLHACTSCHQFDSTFRSCHNVVRCRGRCDRSSFGPRGKFVGRFHRRDLERCFCQVTKVRRLRSAGVRAAQLASVSSVSLSGSQNRQSSHDDA